MEHPTQRHGHQSSSQASPTAAQIERALALARDPQRVASTKATPSVDFHAAARSLLSALAESEVIRAEDLAIRINTRD